jgi:hypothetical protein
LFRPKLLESALKFPEFYDTDSHFEELIAFRGDYRETQAAYEDRTWGTVLRLVELFRALSRAVTGETLK